MILKKNQEPVIKEEWKLLRAGGHDTHLWIKRAMLISEHLCKYSARHGERGWNRAFIETTSAKK